jgi:hypothetical protein
VRQVEYKVIIHATGQLEANLNLLAKSGWRVIYTHYQPDGVGRGKWRLLLERGREGG